MPMEAAITGLELQPAIMAGGGIRAGQVIGATDRTAGDVIARPIHYQDVMATLYHNMGIDAASTTVVDPSWSAAISAGTGATYW